MLQINFTKLLFSILLLCSFSSIGYADTLSVNFNDGTWGSLVRRFGPNDNPAQQDTNYTVRIINGMARYQMPAGIAGARMTGFFDLPANISPIPGDLVVQWTFTNVNELLNLGSATQYAIAGCYIRGEMNHWSGGLFGDYWGAVVYVNGVRVSALRQGNTNLQSEPFTATQSVSYQLRKIGDTILQLWAKYDSNSWHQVGSNVTISLNPNTAGANYNVAVTHVRVLDMSGKAADVSADDFIWYSPNLHITTAIKDNSLIAGSFTLHQNYPNPFNPSTNIRFDLKEAGYVNLSVFNSMGEEVLNLVNKNLATGEYCYQLDGSKLASGIYYCRLETNKNSHSIKMILLK